MGRDNWSNWSGRLTAGAATRVAPQDEDALAAAIARGPWPVRAQGSGHSFTPLAPCDGQMLDLAAFSGVLDHDPGTMTVTAGAATQLGALARAMRDNGQALPNMGDIDAQTLAGALATGTHGSGAGLGAYHAQITALRLIDGAGRARRFSRAADGDIFNGLLPGLGAFGVLTEATLQNVAPYRLRRRRFSLPLAQMLEEFDSLMRAHRSAEFYYIPHSGRVLFIASDLSTAEAVDRPPDRDDESVLLLQRAQRLLGWCPPLRRAVLGRALAAAAREDYVADWLTVYPSERGVRFNEMEYHLPAETGPQALKDLVDRLERDFRHVFFPIEVRIVAPDAGWLSPFYNRPTVSIAVHEIATRDPMDYFNAVEPIFRRHDGRPHWGKMHSLTAPDLAPLYPRWRDAMELRREIDPQGRFINPYLSRLFGLP